MTDTNDEQVNVEEKIKKFCEEFSASMLRAEAERDFRKDAIENIHELTGIDKKTLAFCGKTFHRQDFDEKSAAQTEMQSFYAKVFGIEQEDQDLDDLC